MRSMLMGLVVLGVITTSAMAAPGDSWILPIADRQGSGWTELPGAGYGGTSAWRASGMDGVRRAYWKTDNTTMPTTTELYTIEYFIPTAGVNNEQPIESQISGSAGEIFPNDPNIPWVGAYGTNHQYIRAYNPGTAGTWKAAGPGPHTPDSANYSAGAGGIYMWLHRGSWLYVKWDFGWSIDNTVSAIRLTQVTGPACDTPTITSVNPSTAAQGQSLPGVQIAGSYFEAGATVKLTNPGWPDINATNVVVVDAAHITCDLAIPLGTAVGAWDVVVTTCASGMLADGFTVTIGYCAASGGCDEYIKDVQVGSINNTGTPCSGYADYTGLSTTMTIGVGYPITVTNGMLVFPLDQCGIWVDWNQDGDFADGGETISVTGSPGVGPYTAVITPPVTAALGPARMRTRILYTGTVSPCGSTTYGEVEDYTITVIPCVAPTVTSIDPNSAVQDNGNRVVNPGPGPLYIVYPPPLHVTITGTNFISPASVKLTQLGRPDIVGTNVVVVDATTITADFDLTGAAPGALDGIWTVVVTTCDIGMIPGGFLIKKCFGPVQDVNGDGDVDLTDFSMFQSCFNGPNRAYAGGDPRQCACVDAGENPLVPDVDLVDFSVFQACFNGPNRPPAFACPSPF